MIRFIKDAPVGHLLTNARAARTGDSKRITFEHHVIAATHSPSTIYEGVLYGEVMIYCSLYLVVVPRP